LRCAMLPRVDDDRRLAVGSVLRPGQGAEAVANARLIAEATGSQRRDDLIDAIGRLRALASLDLAGIWLLVDEGIFGSRLVERCSRLMLHIVNEQNMTAHVLPG